MISCGTGVADVSIGTEKVRVMRARFHAELDELMTDLATMARMAAQMMTTAAIALHQTDLALADVVIADRDPMDATLGNAEQRCVSVLALQAPVASDLR